VTTGQEELKNDASVVKNDKTEISAEKNDTECKISAVSAGQEGLKTDTGAVKNDIKTEISAVKKDIEDKIVTV
jgi:hypothetical protein